ncbi:MAG: DEAD/DEAH box helicase [Bradyrhizobium sp.]|nr:DEAD/DEAH box helicase [Bradyrhizobium sp.]
MTALWPHQERGLAMLRQSLMNGARHPVLQLPTGGGKTRLAAQIIKSALAKGNRVAFVVPAISLIDQTVRAFGAEGIEHIGVVQSDHPLTNDFALVQVCSVQTLAKRQLPNVELVIVDECHQRFAVIEKWMQERPEIRFVGLSATPWARGMGKQYDALVIAATTQELIAQGILSKFRVFAPSHPDLSKVHTVAGDYHEGELAAAIDKPELTADVVQTWLRLGENRPTLCFAVNRGHARSLEAQFEHAGVPVAYIDANTPREEREKLGAALEAGRIKVIVNIATMTTGVDLDVRCLILARPTKSEMLYVQIIGRALRSAAGKTDAIILDHSDTTLKLGFVTDIKHDMLDDGSPKKVVQRKTREKAAPLPRECPAAGCHALKPIGVRKCPECGFEPVYREDVAVQEGDLGLLKGDKLVADRATKQRWWSGLAWYVAERGKTEQWAAWRYHDRFGVWPRSLIWAPREPEVDVRNWVKASAIRWAKSAPARDQVAKGRSNVVSA